MSRSREWLMAAALLLSCRMWLGTSQTFTRNLDYFFYWCFVVALVFSCCCCFGGNFWLFFWNKMFTPQVLSSCWKSSKLIQTPTKQTSMGIFPSFIQERTQTTKSVVIHCLLGSPFILKYLRSKASLPQKYSYKQLISRARYRCWYKSVQLL